MNLRCRGLALVALFPIIVSFGSAASWACVPGAGNSSSPSPPPAAGSPVPEPGPPAAGSTPANPSAGKVPLALGVGGVLLAGFALSARRRGRTHAVPAGQSPDPSPDASMSGS